ncbi:MAG: hypothetical protein CM15mP54_18200 [Paracoccaceae bacterium]|nr:MAG: hypothetical protein CM15mP54_18200 [Paracoccaceae bacterium]
MKVAFQMDPIKNVDPKADSTFRIAEEAQLRGHLLFYYEPEQLTQKMVKLLHQAIFLKLLVKKISLCSLVPKKLSNLASLMLFG